MRKRSHLATVMPARAEVDIDAVWLVQPMLREARLPGAQIPSEINVDTNTVSTVRHNVEKPLLYAHRMTESVITASCTLNDRLSPSLEARLPFELSAMMALSRRMACCAIKNLVSTVSS